MQVNIGTQLNNSTKKCTKAHVRASEKADTPSDPVEQTTRAAAPAPPSHWPMQLDVAGVRGRPGDELAVARVG